MEEKVAKREVKKKEANVEINTQIMGSNAIVSRKKNLIKITGKLKTDKTSFRSLLRIVIKKPLYYQ